MKDGQTKISIHTFGCRQIGFDGLVKAPELLVTAVGPPQTIEGAQEGCPFCFERAIGSLFQQGQVVAVDDEFR